MYYEKVEHIPKRRKKRKHFKKKNVVEYLDKFMALNTKYAKLVFDEDDYSNASSAYGSFYTAIDRDRYPITLSVREGELYFTRTDI